MVDTTQELAPTCGHGLQLLRCALRMTRRVCVLQPSGNRMWFELSETDQVRGLQIRIAEFLSMDIERHAFDLVCQTTRIENPDLYISDLPSLQFTLILRKLGLVSTLEPDITGDPRYCSDRIWTTLRTKSCREASFRSRPKVGPKSARSRQTHRKFNLSRPKVPLRRTRITTWSATCKLVLPGFTSESFSAVRYAAL